MLLAAESYAPSVNGVANSVLRMQRHLVQRGHHVEVVAPSPGPDEVEGVSVARVPSRSLPFYRGLPIGLPSRTHLESLFDRVQPDVVHLAAPAILGRRAVSIAARRGISSVAVFQTDVSGFARSYGMGIGGAAVWSWLRRTHELAAVTVAPSTATIGLLEDNGVPRVGLWGRGVDSTLFRPDRSDERIGAALLDAADRDAVVVGYVGRLAKEKRLDLLRGIDERPGVRLVIVGEGPASDELRAMLPHAHFTGLLRGVELAQTLASFDVFVHTGAHEMFCQSIQEAMASGLPVIAPSAGGPLDLVDHGRSGLLYEPENPLALRAAVTTLVNHPEMRRRMGACGVERTVGRSWDVVCDELVSIYRGVVAGDRTGALERSLVRRPVVRPAA